MLDRSVSPAIHQVRPKPGIVFQSLWVDGEVAWIRSRIRIGRSDQYRSDTSLDEELFECFSDALAVGKDNPTFARRPRIVNRERHSGWLPYQLEHPVMPSFFRRLVRCGRCNRPVFEPVAS